MNRKHIVAIALLLGTGTLSAQPQVAVSSAQGAQVFVEAENFDNKGGWKVDQQFMDQMGSPYLLAHGMGVRVKDARTKVRFPMAGTYYAYVRTYNWTSPWSAVRGPGKFRLSVDGRRLETTLGDTGSCWMWQEAGKVTVEAKEVTLALHDLTGFDGRCDALYFTTRKGELPPSDGEELAVFPASGAAAARHSAFGREVRLCSSGWRSGRHECSPFRSPFGVQGGTH